MKKRLMNMKKKLQDIIQKKYLYGKNQRFNK